MRNSHLSLPSGRFGAYLIPYGSAFLMFRYCRATFLRVRGIMAVLFLCCVVALTAQTSDYQPLEWGTVATEDLQMTFYAPDTTASALVLGDEGYMDVGKDNSGQK